MKPSRRRRNDTVVLLVIAALVALVGESAGAAPARPPRAAFAIIVGVNQGVDRDLGALHFADDDAARYNDLFRALGARTYVLTRPDDNTARLHPQIAAEAQAPTARALAAVFTAVAADVAQARSRGVAATLYFVFAGHGVVSDGRGYLLLEDARLDGAELGRLFDRVAAAETHAIVDACYSYFLAFARGPGGRHRPLRGVIDLPGLARRESVGLLLSTSSDRESHEWSAFQAGVFSHEVRSGLYGAADVDGDGQVSYREIAAFVERANAAVPNERFRPDVYARAPSHSDTLVDLRAARDRRLELRRTDARPLSARERHRRAARRFPQCARSEGVAAASAGHALSAPERRR